MSRPGLIDFSVDKAANGRWYIGETRHSAKSPGDTAPVFKGHVGGEHVTEDAAVREAIRLARAADADQVAVFSEGDEVFFHDRTK